MNTTMMMPISQLQPHPLQAQFYEQCTQAEDEALVADLRQNGQRDPVEVMPPDNAAGLPAYTILDGHRRARLLQQLDHIEARVQIRSDLKDADAATVEAEFLKRNFNRRQMDIIDKARVTKRLYELEKGRRIDRYGSTERDARDRVGKMIGMSGRNLNRYWNLLQTPLAVQRAVRDGRLPLVLGDEVAGLPEHAQAEIASRIESSRAKKVKALVSEYFTVVKNSNQAAIRFIRAIDRGGGEVRKLLEKISPCVFAAHLPVLQSAQTLLGDLIQIAEKAPAPPSISDVKAELASLDLGFPE